MTDRYTEETLRLVGLLKALAKTKRRSVRSIEQQMGVGTSIFHKVLKGEVTLHVRHLLMIADALEIDWAEFFHLAYPRTSPVSLSEDSLIGDLNRALGEPGPSHFDGMSDVEFEERVKQVLTHLGMLSEDEESDSEESRFKSA